VPKVVGEIKIAFMDDGATNVEVENLSYIQLYGAAGVISGMALMQQQEMALRAAMSSGKQIAIAQSVPKQAQ
jgi:hypothetical protein